MQIFDQKKIEEIAKKSREEKWAYPRTFEALKEAGVVSYEVDTASHSIVYYGEEHNCKEPAPSDFKPTKVREVFDQAEVKQAIQKVQAGKINYMQFLKDLALAGVKSYRVNMIERSIIYSGSNPNEHHIEHIPKF